MNRPFFFTAFLSLVVFLGAGCFATGGIKSKSADGGVFRSSDAGSTWTQISAVPTSQGMGTLSTSNMVSLELDPTDKSILYAATRENGLLYSEDAGTTWRLPRLAALRDGTIHAVEVDPNNSCSVYISKGTRLYKTNDCLRTFDDEVYVESRGGINIADVGVDWYTRGIVWIGLSNGDVLKSVDDGKSWKTVLQTGKDISEILISNKDSRQVFVAMHGTGIQRTKDGGETWENLESLSTEFKKASNVFVLAQTKDGQALLVATQFGLLKSVDGGSTWEAIKLLTAPGQLAIMAAGIASKDPNVLYYATPNTFYRTADGGLTWQTQKFPSARIPRTLLIDPIDESVLYVGVAAPLK